MDTLRNDMSAELALYRQSTNIAGLCKELVLKSTITIDKRRYVKVEGWTSIAVAHGFIVSIAELNVSADGVRVVAELRRQTDGMVLNRAEGWVGADEALWYGGEVERWNSITRKKEKKMMPKRSDYAIRSMAQTRAAAKVCRLSFSHVIVLMNENLETVPAEEMGADNEGHVHSDLAPKPFEGEGAQNADLESKPLTKENFIGGKWKDVTIHFGSTYKGKKLGELSPSQLSGWFKWSPKPYPAGSDTYDETDKIMRMALDVAAVETAETTAKA